MTGDAQRAFVKRFKQNTPDDGVSVEVPADEFSTK